MAAVLAPVLLALALALQSAPAGQDRARFTSSIDVVQVDVSAVDRNGRPIHDLTVADFELRVDGRPRPIVSAQFLDVPSGGQAPSAAELPYYSSNVDAAGGRLIMIVVDRSSIASGRGNAAIDAAGRFVSQLNRADRVALASIPDGPQVGFTADHELIARMLAHIDGTAVATFGSRNIGIAEALAFERRDVSAMEAITERECGTLAGDGRGVAGSDLLTCRNEVRAEAGLVAADARNRARTSIAALHALIAALPPSQTPKLLVFISEGLVVNDETALLSSLEANAAAAHAAVYALHLQVSEFDPSQRRPQAQSAANRAVQERGLALIAQATRGDMFRIVSNSGFAFQRLAAELSGYYLLAFEADAGDRDGKPHAISVNVRRQGVTVRSRRQFVAGPARVTTPESEIVAALRDPMPAADIPLRLATYSFLDRHDKLQLLIAAEIDRSINPESELSIGYVVVDFNGQLVTSQTATLPASSIAGDQPGRYFSAVRLDPDRYTVKLAVVDDGGRRGSVERVADARLNEAGPIRTTDLVLADGPLRAGEPPLAPAISGEIASGTLHGHVELRADRRDSLNQASLTLEIARSGESTPLLRVPVPLEGAPGNSSARIASVNVDVSQLPLGDYVARVEVAVGFDRVGEVSRRFRIARAPVSSGAELH